MDARPRSSAAQALPRGKSALPRRVVARVQRERILDALVHEVGRHGYAATTIADIVRRARVSRSAFYACFPDKEACFLAACRRAHDAHLAGVQRACESIAQPVEWVTTLARTYVEGLAANPDHARAFIVEIAAAGAVAQRLRRNIYERWAAWIAEWYANVIPRHSRTPLPPGVFVALAAGIDELVAVSLPVASPVVARQLERQVAYLLLAAMGFARRAKRCL
jgi:AcrR family transcriptional regulator